MTGTPTLDIALAALLGLLVGSFLNVVIHRLPKMLERQWLAEAADLLGDPQELARASGWDASRAQSLSGQAAALGERLAQLPALGLARPRSRCPHCGHAIAAWENVPVLSWLALRGRCRGCQARISARYPLVEVATAALFAHAAWRWGITPAGAAWAAFGAVLLALAAIDWDTTFLPDDLTLPLAWGGLLATALGWTGIPLADALWGAAAGYLSLWSVYQGFKLLTGKEGMGYGDFKLFAALGAWFGWQALVPIILVASVVGAVVGIALKLRSSLREGGYVPFGPFLALGGLLTLVAGPAWLPRAMGF